VKTPNASEFSQQEVARRDPGATKIRENIKMRSELALPRSAQEFSHSLQEFCTNPRRAA
jgi:hypothetical protein